jgi:glucokinase
VKSTKWAIGIDLGGQSVKLAAVSDAGQLEAFRQVPIQASWSANEMVDFLLLQMDELGQAVGASGIEPQAVGVVMPGLMNDERTRLLFAANLPKLSDTTFLEDLASRIDMPHVFDADCNAAAWAEFRVGAGTGSQRLIVASIGTGVGAGVIIAERILRVRGHVAGSLGHVVVDPTGPGCACGGRGCVEALASGLAIERAAELRADEDPGGPLARLRDQAGRLSCEVLGQAAVAGERVAMEIIQQAGRYLGVAIVSWSTIYQPDRVLLAGGPSQLGDVWISAIREGIREVGPPRVRDLEIEPAGLGPRAGCIGAGLLAIERF